MESRILTKQQLAAGLRTHEDDHNLYLFDIKFPDKHIATFGIHATIENIQRAANDYLIKRGN